MTTFAEVGQDIVAAVVVGLEAVVEKIKVESQLEVPTSIPPDYDTEFRTLYREGGPQVVKMRKTLDIPTWDETLKNSWEKFPPVITDRSVSIEFGYGFGTEVNPQGRLAAEYAVPVHERLDLLHRPPQKAKYLEGPVLAAAAEMGPAIAASIRFEVK